MYQFKKEMHLIVFGSEHLAVALAQSFVYSCRSLTINFLHDPFSFSLNTRLLFWVWPPCRRSRSQSCPFCRDSLKRVNSADLWIYTDNRDIVDMATVRRENLRRLFMYIDKLPTVIPESVFEVYDSHVKWACARRGAASAVDIANCSSVGCC